MQAWGAGPTDAYRILEGQDRSECRTRQEANPDVTRVWMACNDRMAMPDPEAGAPNI